MTKQTIDVVFTWVDDSFPGYSEQRDQRAGTGHDSNPNRTRDNLDMLKYALRSVDQNLPEIRRVYILCCRPQVPAWLDPDHPDIRIVHHDEIMDASILPTFNSFSIVSHLHLLPDLSEEFLYVEDDMLFLRPGAVNALRRDDRTVSAFRRVKVITSEQLDATREGPWNLAMANASSALTARAMPPARYHIIHGPQLIQKRLWVEMIDAFSEEISRTRATWFRGGDNIPPEFLYPHYALAKGAAVPATRYEARALEGYLSLENLAPWTWLQLAYVNWRNPITATLNDSFGDTPNPRVEKMTKRWLNTRFPTPSRFERQSSAD